jgi:hypothetical protein
MDTESPADNLTPSPEKPSRPVSKKFRPTMWTQYLVPALLILLALALLGALVVVGLSILGLTPGL